MTEDGRNKSMSPKAASELPSGCFLPRLNLSWG